MKGLSAQACFSQPACIDQLEHLMKNDDSFIRNVQLVMWLRKQNNMNLMDLHRHFQTVKSISLYLMLETNLEIGQWAGLGAQRLRILVRFCPLDRFICGKLLKGQTEGTKQMSKYFISHCSWSFFKFKCNLWLEPIRTILVLFLVKTPRPTCAIR